MKSVRLDEALEIRLEEAARVVGVTPSLFIRRAIEEQCDRVLAERLDLRLTDVIGTVHSKGGRARRTGRAFLDTLREERWVRNWTPSGSVVSIGDNERPPGGVLLAAPVPVLPAAPAGESGVGDLPVFSCFPHLRIGKTSIGSAPIAFVS